MALANYSDLQASVASFLHRDDLTSEIPDFIKLAEADLQVRAKLSQWDTSATVTVTSGTGPLPSDFAKATSVTYGAGDYTIDFMSQIGYDAYAASGETGEPEFYTIRGTNLLIYPLYSGDVTLAYTARFTALSGSATTNSLLTLFPDAYLNGSLMHACSWLHDLESMNKYAALFEASITRIKKYMIDYKYSDGLQMRVA